MSQDIKPDPSAASGAQPATATSPSTSTDGQSAGQAASGAATPAAGQLMTVAVPYRPWLPMAIAAGLAGIILVLLHLPGVLRYPTSADPDLGWRQAALQEHNRSLREQIEQAKRLASRDVCVNDGAVYERLLPRGGPIPGTKSSDASPSPRRPDGTASATTRPLPPDEGGNLLPRPPEQMPVPRDSVPNFEGSFADLLDKATVLVVVLPSGMGSGFFISPTQIVTNRHVVDAAGDSGSLMVTNQHLAELKPARLVVKSPRGSPGSPDFAVLEIAALPQPPPSLPLTEVSARLQRVTAAGFPGVVTQSDQKLAALRRGDRTAIPDLVLTQGTITVVQNRDSGNPIIGHEANISPGNSGGPLIDDCARVVGVNTFGVFDDTGKHHVNYALGASSLQQFLQSNKIAFQQSNAVCQPPAPRTADVPAPAAVSGGARAPMPPMPPPPETQPAGAKP